MLELFPVSKFNIQQYNANKKQKVSMKKISVQQNEIQQIDPGDQQSEDVLEHQKNYKNRFFQNSNLTGFIHQKMLIVTNAVMLLSVLSMMVSITQDAIIIDDEEMRKYMLIFHSINTFVISKLTILYLVGLLISRYFLDLTLKKKQLIRVSIRKKWEMIRSLVTQITLILFHPNLLTESLSVMVQQPLNNTYIPLKINDALEIIMLFRLYLIYFGIAESSIYLSTRSNRICRIYGTKFDLNFGMKAFFNSDPLPVLFFIFLTQLITFGQMLKISDRNIDHRFNDLGNCMWCIIITMGTVGYGDYVPATYSGRIVVFMASISGIIMSSLLILTLSTYLSMNAFENKSHITMQKVQLRAILDEYSREAIKMTTSLLKSNRRLNSANKKISLNSKQNVRNSVFSSNNSSIKQKSSSSGILKFLDKQQVYINSQYEELKQKTEQIKHTTRKIKSLVDTDNVNEQMSRLFQVLQDNLKIIYSNQLQYGKMLIRISQSKQQIIDQMKFTFTSEIQNIIKDS